MEIKFYGQACFSVTDKVASLVMDPFSESIGLTLPTLKADVITVSNGADSHSNTGAVQGEPRVFSWPGEYETKGVHFQLIHARAAEGEENNVTIAHFNGIKICHLGAQSEKLTEQQVDKIGDVDILFVPVGGKTVLDAKLAKSVVEEIEPRVVIPMLYSTEGNNQDLAPLSAFLSEMNATQVEPVDSFKVKKSELPEDNSKVVVINQSS